MGLFNREKPAPADSRPRQAALKAVVPASDFKELGKSPGQLHVTRAGIEYVIDTRGTGARDGADLAVRPGDLIVATPLRETLSDGEVFNTTVYRRAVPVPAGTYASDQARREATQAKQAAKDRRVPVDVHSVLPRVVTGTSEVVISVVGSRQPTIDGDRLVAPPDLFGNKPSVPYFPPTPAPESPAGILAWYAKRGVTLTAPGGRLLVEAKGGRLGRSLLYDIRADQRRLVAHLEGRWPLPCERHPDRPAHDAVRTYVLDVLGCDQ